MPYAKSHGLAKQKHDYATDSANTFAMLRKMTKTHPNHLLAKFTTVPLTIFRVSLLPQLKRWERPPYFKKSSAAPEILLPNKNRWYQKVTLTRAKTLLCLHSLNLTWLTRGSAISVVIWWARFDRSGVSTSSTPVKYVSLILGEVANAGRLKVTLRYGRDRTKLFLKHSC